MGPSEITEEEDASSCYQVKTEEMEMQKARIREIIAYQKYMYWTSTSFPSSSASSSSVSSSASFSGSDSSFSLSISQNSSSLMELMKTSGSSLQRLFGMEERMSNSKTTSAAPAVGVVSDYNSMFQSGIPHLEELDDQDVPYRYLTSWSFLESFRTCEEERETFTGGPIDLTSWSPIKPLKIYHEEIRGGGAVSPRPGGLAFRLAFCRDQGWLASLRKQHRSRQRRSSLMTTSLPGFGRSWRWRGFFYTYKWRWIGFRFCLRRRLRIMICGRII